MNQNPACQELQIRLKKGTEKMVSEAISVAVVLGQSNSILLPLGLSSEWYQKCLPLRYMSVGRIPWATNLWSQSVIIRYAYL